MQKESQRVEQKGSETERKRKRRKKKLNEND